MRKLLVGLFAFCLLVGPAQAQTVSADRFKLNTGPCYQRSGTGAPEGVQTANPCDEWNRTDSPYGKYYKLTGTGNTGWVYISGGGTVTSVAFTSPTCLPVTGSPITTSGTIAMTLNAACFIPTGGTSGDWLKSNGASAPSFASPAAITKTDDTNVTLTLGGSPTTAVLNGVSFTLGWTGQSSVPRGGTGGATWTSNGVLYGQGTSALAVTSQGPTNSVLTASAGAPSFSATPTVTSLTTTATVSAGTSASTGTTLAVGTSATTGTTLGVGTAATVGTDFTMGSSTVGTLTYNPLAAIVLGTSSVFRQQAPGATKYKSQWYVDSQTGGTFFDAYDTTGNAYMPMKFRGLSFDFSAATTINGAMTVTGNTNISGYVGHPDYVSQLTKWRIDSLGAADFRYLYTDELHAKAFVADIEQALAGGQIISKSVAVIASDFNCPAQPGIGTLSVEDLPGAANMQVFETGDYVVVRTFSRASGSLTIGDCVGTVSAPDTSPSGTQTWVFTRASTNSGSLTAGTTIQAKSLALDYGVSGNGAYEVSAVDGAYGVNSPYAQIWTFAGSPISANKTLRARFGNLRGITGNTGEYGIIAGTYAATNGQYFRASNSAFELHGIDLSLWSGSSRTLFMDHATPAFSMGTPAPTSFTSGSGCWQGLDAGVFKWRCGDIAGGTQYISWNGTQLTVAGNIVVTGTSIDAATVTGVSGATVVSGAARGLLGIDSVGNPSLPAVVNSPSSGLYLGSDKMGYYTSGAWKTYMDSSGNFYLGGTSGKLQWNGTALTLSFGAGDVSGWVLASTSITDAAGVVGLSSAVTGGNDCRIWSGHATCTSAPFRVYEDGSFVATSGTFTGSVTVTGGNAATTTYADGIGTAAATDATTKANAAVSTAAADATTKANTVATASLDKATYLTPATTTINGGTITTGTVTAAKISTSTLAAIVADLGAVTAGSIVVGSSDKIWLNEGADGVLAVGGSTKASAPFRLTPAGALTATNAVLTSNSGTVTVGGGGIAISLPAAYDPANGYKFTPGSITGTSYGLFAQQTDATNRYLGLLNLSTANGAQAWTDIRVRAKNISGTTYDSALILFAEGTSGVTTALLTANSIALVGAMALTGNTIVNGTATISGDVAVNTNKFTVTASNGNTAVAGTLAVAANVTITSASDGPLTINYTGGADPNTQISFLRSGVDQGSITSTAGTTQYNAMSDRRLKNDLGLTHYGLDDLMQIEIHDFTMKSDTSRVHTGVFAQQLKPIYGDPVTSFSDDRMWQVDYGKLTPLLIASMQDLKREVDSLRREIAILKGIR